MFRWPDVRAVSLLLCSNWSRASQDGQWVKWVKRLLETPKAIQAHSQASTSNVDRRGPLRNERSGHGSTLPNDYFQNIEDYISQILWNGWNIICPSVYYG